ncbi:MAG: radical SAM protein [Phycisphaerae bacterium]|nr:radical SAM protein [Phycisphaerae bacterium]
MSKCDVVLIFPPIRTWDNPRNFPTGTGLVAAILRDAGYSVKVIDANGLRLTQEQTVELLKEYDPAIIGVGGLITTYKWIKELMPLVREGLPGKPVVLGGSVGTSIIETALRNLDIDIICVCEGDVTMPILVDALLNGKEIADIEGIAYLKDDQVVKTPERTMVADLDALPMVAWDLFPMDVYLQNPVVGVGRDIDIISSRGCPFNCRYCYRIFGRKFRARSAANVVAEIEALRERYDVDFISFQDDCFVIDKKRVYEICDLMDAKGLSKHIRWSCTGRVTVCDYDLLKRMKDSGCVSVSYGIESGSQDILNNMGKDATLDQDRAAIANTRKAGLRCPVSFMIGYPGETEETVMQTVEFCKEENIPLSALMFTCPYPGTALYEQVKDTENFKKQYPTEEEFVLTIGDAIDFTVNLTDIDKDELISIRDRALKLVAESYVGPTAAEIEAQDKELYGPELYAKAQKQMENPAMQEHRKRHGFNEGKK